MTQLEDSVLDKNYGLFTGPAVYQDGIAAYDEPIYDPSLDSKSYVLDHPNSHNIKCLSTNAVYYQAYVILGEMARKCEPSMVSTYKTKATTLKQNFRKYFYNANAGKLNYLIDGNGKAHEYQEALGEAYTIMFGLVTPSEAKKIISNTYQSANGIPCVWPCFPRNSVEKPGRHNVMIWPHVNMAYAAACATVGETKPFWFEINQTADMVKYGDARLNPYDDGAEAAKECAKATDVKPEGNFHEIYTVDGIPSGGWQCGTQWPPLNHQTWCATGYLNAFYKSICGMTPTLNGLAFNPMGMEDGSEVSLKNITYRKANINITVVGKGTKVKKCTINGKASKPFIPANASGNYDVEIQLI